MQPKVLQYAGFILAVLGLTVHGLLYYFTKSPGFLISGGLTGFTGCLLAIAGMLMNRRP